MKKNLDSRGNFYTASEYFRGKAYLNPKVINCAPVLVSGDATKPNKIHINPNFRGPAVNYNVNTSVQEKSTFVHINPYFDHGNRRIFKSTEAPVNTTAATLNYDDGTPNQRHFSDTYNNNTGIYKLSRYVVNNSAYQVNVTGQKYSSSTLSWSSPPVEKPVAEPNVSGREVVKSCKQITVAKLSNPVPQISTKHELMYKTNPVLVSQSQVKETNNKFKLLNPYKIVNAEKVVSQCLKDPEMYPGLRKKVLPWKTEFADVPQTMNNFSFFTKLRKHLSLRNIKIQKYKFPHTSRNVPLNKIANLIRLKYIYKNKSSSKSFNKYKHTESFMKRNHNTYKLDKRSKESSEKGNMLHSLHKISKKGNCCGNKFKSSVQKPVQWQLNWNKSLHWGSLKKRQMFEEYQQKHFTASSNKVFPCVGGIMYKSALKKLNIPLKVSHCNKNKMTNAVQTSRSEKHHIVNVRGEKFLLRDNGKVLIRQTSNVTPEKSDKPSTVKRVDLGGVTYIQKSGNVLIQTKAHQARLVLNYARQRSIIILHNSKKKNNMPCRMYQRFGKCMRHSKGMCMYVHDPKKIDLCKKFIKGQCFDTNCLLSHNVVKEKVPTCHFFLNGNCNREDCPYLHVKVNKKADICNDFLSGFCSRGQNCLQRHIRLCPDFDKKGACVRGVKCPYPHSASVKRKYDSVRNGDKFGKDLNVDRVKSGRFDKTCLVKENGKTKMRKRKSKKSTKEVVVSVPEPETDPEIIECIPKRIKLDQLPLFIPLDAS